MQVGISPTARVASRLDTIQQEGGDLEVVFLEYHDGYEDAAGRLRRKFSRRLADVTLGYVYAFR